MYEQGLPVEDIYEKHVHGQPSEKFKNFPELKFETQSDEVDEPPRPEDSKRSEPSFLKFDPDASYDGFNLPKAPTPKRPNMIEALDFVRLDKYKEYQKKLEKEYMERKKKYKKQKKMRKNAKSH